MTHAVSAAGLALIQDFEGFTAEPQALPDGHWLVGFGHVRVGEPGAPVNRDEAAGLLSIDLAPVERMVNRLVSAPLSQSQFDALVSFAASIGGEEFAKSQVLRRVNAGEFVAAACAMDAWRKAEIAGELHVVDALVRRRAAEKALFLQEMAFERTPAAVLRAKLDYAASVLGAPIRAAAPALKLSLVSSAAPATAPVAETPAQRLTQILQTEPATELLLTCRHVEEAALADEADEIVTAHAKPVARAVEEDFTPPVARDRRQSPQRKRPAQPQLDERFKTIVLAALLVCGVGFTIGGGALFVSGRGDVLQIIAAFTLTAPGLIAAMLAAFGLLREPLERLVRA